MMTSNLFNINSIVLQAKTGWLIRNSLSENDFENLFPTYKEFSKWMFRYAQKLGPFGKRVGLREFIILSDRLTLQGHANVHLFFDILKQKTTNENQLLEDFFQILFEMFSDSVPVIEPNFGGLYFHVLLVKEKKSEKFFCDFVSINFPLVSRLLASYFTSKFTDKPAKHSTFRCRDFHPLSCIDIPEMFSLYLSNPQYCLTKDTRLYLIYTTHGKKVCNSSDIG